MKKESVLLDVFTDTPFTGNQLAVFAAADDLNADQMQMIAKEINYSETTFILESTDKQADFDIRIFTPRTELPFAGHPTLGTAYALLNHFDTGFKNEFSISLRTKVGIIRLERSGDNIWMRQNEPEFFKVFDDKQGIAELAGLNPEDISHDYPVEEVSTGNAMLLVPVKGLSAIHKAAGNANKISDFFEKNVSLNPYFFTFETEDPGSSVHTRLFAPHLGIIEDPATGSAAGPLTAYLLKYGIFGESFEIQNEQGLEMGRPSKIMMRGNLENGKYKVEVGGTCRIVGGSFFYI